MIKIDKNIAVPPFKKALKYTFEEMEVGDSFLVDRDIKRNITLP